MDNNNGSGRRNGSGGFDGTSLNSLERFKNRHNKSFLTLTEKEVTILSLVALGMAGAAIAEQVGMTEQEVRVSRGEIDRKLSIQSRAEYIKYAFAFGLISF